MWLPFLQATCLKFLCTFRNQFESDLLNGVLPLLGGLMRSKWFVVHSYAAVALDKFLLVT